MADNKTIVIQNPEENEDYTTRPNRKPDVANRGKLLGWIEEGVYQFAARVSRSDMQHEVLLKQKDLKVAKTRGEKDSSIILTAKVDANATDPYGALLLKCETELGPKAKKMPKVQQANCLLEEDGRVKVWHKKKDKRLACYIELDVARNKELIYKEFLEIQAKIYKVIARNKF